MTASTNTHPIEPAARWFFYLRRHRSGRSSTAFVSELVLLQTDADGEHFLRCRVSDVSSLDSRHANPDATPSARIQGMGDLQNIEHQAGVMHRVHCMGSCRCVCPVEFIKSLARHPTTGLPGKLRRSTYPPSTP